ncbi:MAG: aminoglycoside 6-adenylyltransferase [Cyanobacteria bacterium P01_C01_bin.120]
MTIEHDIFDLIKRNAQQEERIRAAILNGSRACKSVKKDPFQDFDVIYLTSDLQFFIDNHDWIDCFGERIILEMPWYKDFEPEEYGGQFNYQMLLKNGFRIDLTFASLDRADFVVKNDPVGAVLLDKDGLINESLFADESIYLVKPPTRRKFENCCNSFWWVLQNVAKGIRRAELPYAMTMLHFTREELHRVISWHIGLMNEFSVSSGKMGKYFEKHLDDNHWRMYQKTYPSADYDSMWQAVSEACHLFRELSIEIADGLSFEYPHADDKAMTAYLEGVRYSPENVQNA